MIRSKLHTFLFIFIGTVLLVITFTGCETGRAACEGKIEVANPISDTTLYLGGEKFQRDLFENPPVFRHTANLPIILSGLNSDKGGIVSTSGIMNQETGKVSIIQVSPLSIGQDKVIITVTDGCPDYDVSTSFNVTVIDTTN